MTHSEDRPRAKREPDDDTGNPESPGSSPHAWRDALCIGLLLLACVALRLPSLDRVSLNPDESQYEAAATYLVATGTSAFLPYGAPGTYLMFKAMTRVFGNYPMFEMRTLFLLIALYAAVLLYGLVRRESNRACGLAAGLVFLHFTMVYQGLTVNREWPAVLMIVGGISLGLEAIRREGRTRIALLVLSGLVSGGAVWFKLQALFTVVAVAALLVWDGFARRRFARSASGLAAYVVGGLLAGVAYLAPYAFAGTMGELLREIFGTWDVMVTGTEEVIQQAAGGSARLYPTRFYGQHPYRPLLLVAYAFTAAIAVDMVRIVVARLRGLTSNDPDRADDTTATPGTVVLAVGLVSAAFCVKLGNRFFDHYYLLMMPAVAGLVGLALHHVAVRLPDHRTYRIGALVVGLAIVLDRAVAYSGYRVSAVLAGLPASLPIVLHALAIGAVLAYLLPRPLRRARAAVVALIVLEIAVLVVQQQGRPTPADMSHSPYRFRELTSYLHRSSDADDRIFVWGWAPEIYSLSGLEAATHITIAQYVVNDYETMLYAPTLNEVWATRLMDDLRIRRPEWVVDASRRSWTTTSPDLYRLDLHPGLELGGWLRERYARVGTFDGCDVYRRLDPGS